VSNFNNTIKHNTNEERIKILTALIEKKRVYYYVWNAVLKRMERMHYISDKAPDFNSYRYETEDTYVGCKTTVKFECGGFVNSMITNGYYATPDRTPLEGSHIKVWFDLNKNLNIELLNANIVVHPHPTAVKQATPVPLEKKDQAQEDAIERLVRDLRGALRFKKKRFRTAQFPNSGGDYMYFPTSEMVSSYYYAIFKLKDCVLISKDTIPRMSLARLRLNKRDRLVMNQVDNTVMIDGFSFEKLTPGSANLKHWVSTR